MKVLQVITSLNTGGAERLLVESIPLYQKKSVQMDLLVLKDEKTMFRQQLAKSTIGKLFFLTRHSPYNPFLILKIIPILSNYDVIHAHLFPVLYWVVIARFFSKKKPVIVYTEHSTNNRRRNNYFLRKVEKFIYSKLDYIGCISRGTKDELIGHLRSLKKVEVINNGVNLSRFRNLGATEYNFPFYDPDVKYLIQVSSFRHQKDQKTLIRALCDLPKSIELILVGEGPLKLEAEKYAHDLNLKERVLFLGDRSDIPELLNLSHIVVLSSTVEGFGLVIVEGMAAGKPVIASDIIGVSEIVENYGLLFEVGNARDLSDKIKLLLEDPYFYNKISLRCKLRAEDFTLENMVDKYIDVYKNEIRENHEKANF